MRARLFGVPFDYPFRPYTFQLVDYFIKGLEHAPCIGGTDHALEIDGIQGIQHALGQMCFSYEAIEAPSAMIIASPSPGRASVFSMCFPEEVLDYDLRMDLGDDTDEVTLPNTYMDEMDMIGIGRILDAAPPRPLSIFYMFGISMLEIDDDDGLVATDIIHNTISVKEAPDSVDPPLSFDTMSGFVTRFDDISDGNNDMSIFKYLPVSHHFLLIAPPTPTTHIYDVDDVGDTNDPLGGQS